MKAKIITAIFLVFLYMHPVYCHAQAGYQEINTPSGKAFTGLTREEALQEFGVPDQAGKDTWAYLGQEKFFVFFTREPFLNIYLYPLRCTSDIGVPLEFKVFGYSSDMTMKDITREADLLVSEPEDFILDGAGIIISRRAGEYQVLAKYKGVFSNPAYLTIKEPQQKEMNVEKLVSINILPHKPAILAGNKLDFIALGTFISSSGAYYVKNISKQVAWQVKQGMQTAYAGSSVIYFPFSGNQEVSCRYQDLQSPPQEVYVSNKPPVSQEKLKHITILPEVIPAILGKNINISAFGTYYNNRVEDITRKVRWEITDTDVVVLQDNGSFLAKSVGLTDITAVLDGLRSPAAKIIVANKATGILSATEQKRVNPKKLAADIKNEIQKLKKQFSGEEKKLILVKITPGVLSIPVGEKGEFTALGVYSDNSQDDLTSIADWSSSNDKIVSVLNGKINTFSSGEAGIYAKFKDVKSLPALVKVEGPKLVSIILAPQNIETTMDIRPDLKAEGYYSDSSRKDITSIVNWEFANPRIIKIEKGKVFPLRFGQTSVYAEHLGIKSLPVNVSVIFTMAWLSGIIIKTIVFLILAAAIAFIFLYILTEREKNRLREHFKNNPSEFMVILYGNLRKILAIFNLTYKENIPPLSYAELIQKKLSIEDNSLLRFTVKFEEARYSHHALVTGDASGALNDYNDFLKALFSRSGKVSLFLKYCRSLWLCTPFFITSA